MRMLSAKLLDNLKSQDLDYFRPMLLHEKTTTTRVKFLRILWASPIGGIYDE